MEIKITNVQEMIIDLKVFIDKLCEYASNQEGHSYHWGTLQGHLKELVKSLNELDNRLKPPSEVVAGQIWRNTKTSRDYIINCIAEHTETHEKMIIYFPESGSGIWCRPLCHFLGTRIDDNGIVVKRFILQEES